LKRITHVIFGIGSALFLLTPSIEKMVFAIFFSALGSVFPDMDIRFRHRVFLHNVFALTIATAVLFFILKFFINIGEYVEVSILSFTIGFFTHILLDTLTKTGVAFLWPFTTRRISFLKERYDNPYLNYVVSLMGVFFSLTYIYIIFKGGI